jgi:hypothetical protein
LVASVAIARDATPAVVNPVIRPTLRQSISLDGDWSFVTDPQARGDRDRWFDPQREWRDAKPLKVPACWEAQGVGGPGPSKPVAVEQSIRPLIGSYVGAAWYRKQINIPGDWSYKRIWLKIGGVNSQGSFWINGQPVGDLSTYCGAYKFEVTDLIHPGESATIVAKVRNDLSSPKGLFNWIARFGGLYRSVELEATNDSFIDNAYVEPDLDHKRALVHVRIHSPQPRELEIQVKVSPIPREGEAPAEPVSSSIKLEKNSVDTTIAIPLNPCLPWSPEEPNLYVAHITLRENNQDIDDWTERFGIRKLEVKNGNLFLNNRRYFLRGFGDDFIYPLTLCSPASRDEHRKHLLLAKQYGFNYVRHHTHCEVPEFYEAADEVGIMVQPELPYYGDTPSSRDPTLFQPETHLTELIDHYRRYVSLSTYCMGNEDHITPPLDRKLYDLAKWLDPTRLVVHQDGGANTPENSDWGKGLDVKHEYLNLAVEEDPRLEPKYTGALQPPRKLSEFRNEITKLGLPVDLAEQCFDAGHELQRIWQKHGLESARRDERCDGYIFWTLVDVGSPSAQGLLNQFWESKRSTPGEFRNFNAPTVILGPDWPAQSIAASGDRLRFTWRISNFSSSDIKADKVQWTLRDSSRILAATEAPIGECEIAIPEVQVATQATLFAAIPNTDIKNEWLFYLFPKPRAAPRTHPNVIITSKLTPDIITRMTAGQRVLVTDLSHTFRTISPGTTLGWWTLSQQRGAAIAKHPAFGSFPHDGYLSPALFRIVSLAARWSDLHSVEPLMISHGQDDWLIYVFQAKVGGGGFLATGLDVTSNKPESQYLREQMLHYLASDQFKPIATFDPAKHPSTIPAPP